MSGWWEQPLCPLCGAIKVPHEQPVCPGCVTSAYTGARHPYETLYHWSDGRWIASTARAALIEFILTRSAQ